MLSSSFRRKTAFVPWLAALVLGAAVHAGWLIHELCEPPTLRIEAEIAQGQGAHAPDDDRLDLDMWIEQTERHTYTIDRRVLDRVALADFDGESLERLGVVAQQLGLGEPLELRNIRAGTPLYLLGLRTGDRVRAISTHGGPELERVEVAIERRGRPIALVYRLI